jgi:serine/threonine-protein kinase
MKKPERVGPYSLLSLLGERARGHVWLAGVGSGPNRLVLKLAPPGDAVRRARLLHEVDIAGGFDHPNIVRMHECGESQGFVWMAMGYVSPPRPAAAPTLANFRQLLLAMVHIHAHGVVHAAIAPAKLLINEDGDLLLAGFGSARKVGAAGAVDAISTRFMPPEQLRGEELDFRADLFSAGAVLYQILVGKPVFDGKAVQGSKPVVATLAPPSEVAHGLGTSFDKLIAKVLSPDKAGRHVSAFEVLRDFDAACHRGVRISV